MDKLKNIAFVAFAAIGIISCSNSDRTQIEVHTGAVDLTEFNRHIIRLIEESDLEYNTRLFQNDGLFPEHDIFPDPRSHNTIDDTYRWKHRKTIDKYREVYNLNIIGSNLVSIMEIVDRAMFTGSILPPADWINEMISYDPNKLQLASSKEWLTSTIDYLNNVIDTIFISDSIDYDIDFYEKIMNHTLLSNAMIENDMPNPQSDSSGFWAIADQVLDWKKYAQDDVFSSLCAIDDEETRVIEFLNMLNGAGSFKKQCAYALCAEMTNAFGETVPVLVLEKLLTSGHYSEYQYQTWLGWRSLAQITNYGRSRDSDIADQWYNDVRKTAMIANLAYMDAHPNDMVARLNFLLTSIRSNIIRNGSFIMGSDASLDYYEVFK